MCRWTVFENKDISLDYAASCQRQVKAEKENKGNLIAAIGASEYSERQARWESKLSVLDDRLLRRELFAATPVWTWRFLWRQFDNIHAHE